MAFKIGIYLTIDQVGTTIRGLATALRQDPQGKYKDELEEMRDIFREHFETAKELTPLNGTASGPLGRGRSPS